MPRYAPAPPPPEPKPKAKEPARSPMSGRRKILALFASTSMVMAFVFNFLPKSSPHRVAVTTTTAAPTTSTSTSTTSTSTSTSVLSRRTATTR